MPCSVCGTDGHNAKTCPNRSQPAIPSGTHVLWVKFDNITLLEADALLKAAIDIKSSVAPNARGTFAKGTKNEMSKKIAEALKLSQKDIDDGPKKIE